MYSEELLISATSEKPSISLDLFFASPGDLLDSGSEFLWFTTRETLPAIDSAKDQLSESDAVIQFYSTEWIHSFLSMTPRTVQAAVGVTGLTAIKTELVRQSLAETQPQSGIELLLAVAERNSAWNFLEQADSQFRLRSPIPASSTTNGGRLLSVLNNLPEKSIVSDHSDSTTLPEILAGLLLIHDFLDPSHESSQSIEGMGTDRNGDYWHGIMHRREPDFGNAKYWFRRVGHHPCFVKLSETANQLVEKYDDSELREAIQTFTSSGWDSLAAVDFFQKAHHPGQKGNDWHAFAEELQLSEMLILLTHCYS